MIKKKVPLVNEKHYLNLPKSENSAKEFQLLMRQNHPFDTPQSNLRRDSGQAPGVRSAWPAPPAVGTGAYRQGLILSGTFYPILRPGTWRRRSINLDLWTCFGGVIFV
jgi:hypothetical protein